MDAYWFPVFVKLDGFGSVLTGVAAIFVLIGIFGLLIDGETKVEESKKFDGNPVAKKNKLEYAKTSYIGAWALVVVLVLLGLVGIWFTLISIGILLIGLLIIGVLFLLGRSIKVLIGSSDSSSSSSKPSSK